MACAYRRVCEGIHYGLRRHEPGLNASMSARAAGHDSKAGAVEDVGRPLAPIACSGRGITRYAAAGAMTRCAQASRAKLGRPAQRPITPSCCFMATGRGRVTPARAIQAPCMAGRVGPSRRISQRPVLRRHDHLDAAILFGIEAGIGGRGIGQIVAMGDDEGRVDQALLDGVEQRLEILLHMRLAALDRQ